MSDTPRTDAEFKLEAFFDGVGIVETVLVEFARQLENELADKDKQLAEARAEIERLKCCTNCGSRLWAATGSGDCKNCKDFSAWTPQNKAALTAERGE
jgi:hypothetical protein